MGGINRTDIGVRLGLDTEKQKVMRALRSEGERGLVLCPRNYKVKRTHPLERIWKISENF